MKFTERVSAAYRAFKGSGLVAIKEATEIYPGSGVTLDSNDYHYRSYTMSRRDLPSIKQERAIELSYVAYEKNPLAQRLIRFPVEAISSAGLDFKSHDDRVYQLWSEWWDDPIAGFKNELFGLVGRSLLIDAALSGESIWPFVAHEYTGILDIAYIDPINVDRVLMFPGNARKPKEVVLKKILGVESEKNTYQIARRKFDRSDFEGEVFYFPLNSPVNATRGRPSLYALIDWLDLYDQALFNDSERWSGLRSVLWDVEMKGNVTEQQMIAHSQRHFPNGTVTGSRVHIHNENISVKAITPDLKANDATELSNLIRRYITSGHGVPDFMLGFSGDVGSASIREMSIPMVWMIEQYQRFVQYVVTSVFSCVLVKAVRAGRQLESGKMDSAVDLFFEVKPRSVFPRDMVQLTSTFVQAVAGAEAAEQAGYLSHETCQEIVLNAVGQLGIEKGIDEEQELIAKEKAELDVEDDELDDDENDESEVDKNLKKEMQRDVTGMTGETMPQNKRLVQMSYVPEAYGSRGQKRFRKAWEKSRNGLM